MDRRYRHLPPATDPLIYAQWPSARKLQAYRDVQRVPTEAELADWYFLDVHFGLHPPMRNTTVILDEETAEVLSRCTFQGFNLYLPASLSRETYKKVDQVLRLAGATWDRRQPAGPSGIKGAHVLADAAALAKLGLSLQQGSIVDTKKQHQQFFTPREVAQTIVNDHLYELLQMDCYDDPTYEVRILEPSAGDGSFADAIRTWVNYFHECQAKESQPLLRTRLVCIELDESLVGKLRAKGHKVVHRDFLTVEPRWDNLADFIFMNPPFAGGQDMRHVMHAFRFLKPGGKLVAITSPNAGRGGSALHLEYRAFQQAFGNQLEVLEAGTFKESGTCIETVVVEFIHPDF